MGKDTFTKKAPGIMRLLMADFGMSKLDAAAVMGNLGHESAGLTAFQEISPIKGRGGWGWAQWTGPRRYAFEAYCERNGLDPKSDQANYGFLFVELRGSERRAIDALRAAKTLEDKVIAFERAYERAGVKAYASRIEWAKLALDAWEKSGLEKMPPPDVPAPNKPNGEPDDKPPARPNVPKPTPAAKGTLIGSIIAAIFAFLGGMKWLAIAAVAIAVVVAIYLIRRD